MDTPESSPSAKKPAEAPAIDIQKLTAKVYQLMLADLRKEKARGEQIQRPKERRR